MPAHSVPGSSPMISAITEHDLAAHYTIEAHFPYWMEGSFLFMDFVVEHFFSYPFFSSIVSIPFKSYLPNLLCTQALTPDMAGIGGSQWKTKHASTYAASDARHMMYCTLAIIWKRWDFISAQAEEHLQVLKVNRLKLSKCKKLCDTGGFLENVPLEFSIGRSRTASTENRQTDLLKAIQSHDPSNSPLE